LEITDNVEVRVIKHRGLGEQINLEEEVKSTTTKAEYGQTQAKKTNKDSRTIACKTCGHNGTKHRFTHGYTGNHNCYLCDCSNYTN
jgi:hypothetical protein